MSIAIEKIKRMRFDVDRIYEEIAGVRSRAAEAATSSSSSIGEDSGSLGSNGQDSAGDDEAESKYKEPLDKLDSLEEALPIRRGISNFYHGKSKSFASLSDITVSCPSIKDISKQENAYTRKKRNLLASKNFSLNSSRSNKVGICKKSLNNGRNMLALAVAMNNSSSNHNDNQEHKQRLLPPLHPSVKITDNTSSMVHTESPQYCSFTMRSFSMADLQGITGKF